MPGKRPLGCGRNEEGSGDQLSVLRAIAVNSAARYMAVGAGLFLLDFAVFLLLVIHMDVTVPVSQAIARAVGAIAGFFAHRQYTFAPLRRDYERLSPIGQAWAYTGLTLVMIVWSPWVVMFTVWLCENVVVGKAVGESLLFIQVYIVSRFIFASPGGRSASRTEHRQ